ncbi:ABC transporter ATP-binding protein [Haloarchaeobius sp. DYHT-AS-18]|uniref:ABC transporter ATP-binding protein n=1 Tax=Haloarchaeobius sp. DYHT-AS-18 TaxID=3446117 RepID=UPI003EB83E33
MSVLLDVDDLQATLGNVPVLRGVSLTVDEGETVALVGRNGAGKTTTFRCIMGLVTPTGGTIRLRGEDVTTAPTHERPSRGVAIAPEDRRLFGHLSVRDNLQMAHWGAGERSSYSFDEAVSQVTEIFPEMTEFLDRPAAQLSGGQQKMVAIGRTIASDPDLILLDEPFEGLAPAVREQLTKGIKRIQDLGVSIVIAESNIRYAEKTADEFFVVERGEMQARISSPENLLEHEEIKRIFEGS